MQNEFDAWNSLKKGLDDRKVVMKSFPQVGEVWICSLGKNIGFEQNGTGRNFSRPVLIVTKFNNHMFWAVPLSTKQKNLNFYYNFTDPHNNEVSVILAQMKLISVKRLQRDIYVMKLEDFLSIKEKLRSFI